MLPVPYFITWRSSVILWARFLKLASELYVCNGYKAENKVLHWWLTVYSYCMPYDMFFSVILSPWKYVVQLPLYINNFQLLFFKLLKYCVPARKAFSEKVPPEIEFEPLHTERFPRKLSKNKWAFLPQIFKLRFIGFWHFHQKMTIVELITLDLIGFVKKW